MFADQVESRWQLQPIIFCNLCSRHSIKRIIASSSRNEFCSYGRAVDSKREIVYQFVGHDDTLFYYLFQDVEPLLLLVRWLPEISKTDQYWLAVAVHQMCTSSIQR
jgi:hypothetical protein